HGLLELLVRFLATNDGSLLSGLLQEAGEAARQPVIAGAGDEADVAALARELQGDARARRLRQIAFGQEWVVAGVEYQGRDGDVGQHVLGAGALPVVVGVAEA